MFAIELAFAAKQRHHILHGEVLDSFTTFNGGIGELAFCFLELEDAFFDRVVDAEAVDSYIDGLVEAVDTVDCLFFNELLRS